MNEYSERKIDGDIVESLNTIDSSLFVGEFFVDEDIEKMRSIEKMVKDTIVEVERVQSVPMKMDAEKKLSVLKTELGNDKVFRLKSSFDRLKVLSQELLERKNVFENANSVPLKMETEKRIIELENEIKENKAYMLISDFNQRIELEKELEERKKALEIANAVPLKMDIEKRITEIEKILNDNDVYLLKQNLEKIQELKKELSEKKEALDRVQSVPLKMELEKEILEIEKCLEEYTRIYNGLLDNYLDKVVDLEEEINVVRENDGKEVSDDEKLDKKSDDNSFEEVMKNQEEIYNRDPIKVGFAEESTITKDAMEEFDKLFEDDKKDSKEENDTKDSKEDKDNVIDKHSEIKLNFKRLDEMEEKQNNKSTYVLSSEQVARGMKDPVVGASTLFAVNNVLTNNEVKKEKEPKKSLVSKIKEIPSKLEEKAKDRKPSIKKVGILKRLKNNVEKKKYNDLTKENAIIQYQGLVKLKELGSLSEYYNNDPKYYDELFDKLRSCCLDTTFSLEDLDEIVNSITVNNAKGK